MDGQPSEIYIIVCIQANGFGRCALTTEPKIPDNFAQPGEIAFVVKTLDIQSRHNHQI